MKHDTSAAGQHAEPDRKLVVPPSGSLEEVFSYTRVQIWPEMLQRCTLEAEHAEL